MRSGETQQKFRSTYRLNLQGRKKSPERYQHTLILLSARFILVSCLAYTSILNMVVIISYETYADFHRTTRCCIREHRNLQRHSCENLITKMLDNIQKFKTYLHSYIKSLSKACKLTQYASSTSHLACSRNRCEL
jgi:hypothetical protein